VVEEPAAAVTRQLEEIMQALHIGRLYLVSFPFSEGRVSRVDDFTDATRQAGVGLSVKPRYGFLCLLPPPRAAVPHQAIPNQLSSLATLSICSHLFIASCEHDHAVATAPRSTGKAPQETRASGQQNNA
jgi:hypothetical protein